METLTPANLFYWFILSLIITLETLTIGLLWRRREAARWTLGYATVFGLGLPLVLLGHWDAPTYMALFIAVGLSGAIKTGADQYISARRAAQFRRFGLSHPEVQAYTDTRDAHENSRQ